jgi:hypothetical protein
MISPYLERPLLPLTVVLPRLLENIDAKLANQKLEAASKEHFQRRAELIRSLLTPEPVSEKYSSD